MTNVNEFAETPRPTTNMIQYVGGATLYEPKPLSKVKSTFHIVPIVVCQIFFFRNFDQKVDFLKIMKFQELDELLDERPSTVLFSMGSLVQSKDMPAWLKGGRFKC